MTLNIGVQAHLFSTNTECRRAVDAALRGTMSRTKIVATVGPASSDPAVIAALLGAGADVFRLNMSHGEHSAHLRVIRAIREAAAAAGRPAGILCDLSGPKIRIGAIAAGTVPLEEGREIVLTTEETEGTASRAWVNYPGLAAEVEPGQRILLDDGLLEFEVRGVEAPEVRCVVVRGGPLSSRKGVNLPGARLAISPMTDKDRADMAFGLENDADMFAASFVRRAEDIGLFRDHMRSLGGDLPILAKIEKQEAVDDLEGVLREADGAMVARGDLGVEIPMEQVPIVQKRVIAACNEAGKPVITATQMLDSMIRSPRPTRAEVSDVANAIFDGTDAVMLSGETAVGAHPVAAVRTMERVAHAAEEAIAGGIATASRPHIPLKTVPDAISRATTSVAADLGIGKILCLSYSGSTARLVARYRPPSEILTFCPLARTAQQLALMWGVSALPDPEGETAAGQGHGELEALAMRAIAEFKNRGHLRAGERIVITAGVPMYVPGTTNFLRVHDVA
jgi:pyruvate kinase